MSGDDDEKRDASIVAAYLDSEKYITETTGWKNKGRKDYAEAKMLVQCSSMPEINGELRLTAHKTRIPQKFSFTLLAGSIRIMALDVNPASAHFNVMTLESVSCTHWQCFPSMEAEADSRERTFHEWFREFCRRAKIDLQITHKAPPHTPVQLDLL